MGKIACAPETNIPFPYFNKKYTFKTPSFEKLKLSVMTIWSCVI